MSADTSGLSSSAVALVVIVAGAVLVYSVLVMAAPLAGLSVIVPLVALYLLWRFVRAHERIADAMEAGALSDSPEN